MGSSVAQAQDEFKLKTLEAMARGQDPYGQASTSVSEAEQKALQGQVADNAGGNAPPQLQAELGAQVTGSSDAVQDYLGQMQGAQSIYDQAFSQAAANYAPPPIYSTRSSGGGGGGGGAADAAGGLTADDLAIKPMIFPEEYGGGLRYGGFRTQAEGNAAVLGAAEVEAGRLQAEEAALAAATAAAQQKAAEARQGFTPKMGRPKSPVVSRGLRFAEEEGNEARWAAGRKANVEQAVREGYKPATGMGALTEESLAAGRRAGEARRADVLRASRQPSPVVSRGNRLIEEERNAYDYHGPAGQERRQAIAAEQAFVMPEAWEIQRQSALDWGYNPYIAAGLYDAPTPAERAAAIRSELELSDRMGDPEGRLPSERASFERAMAEQLYGPQVVDGAAAAGVTPDEYVTFASDPVFQQAEQDAAAIFYDPEQPGNLDQILDYLIGQNLPAGAINMILEPYRGLGLNPASANVDPNYVVGG